MIQLTIQLIGQSSSWFHCKVAGIICSKEAALYYLFIKIFCFFYKNVSWEYKKGRGDSWVSEFFSLQKFCIPAHCLRAGIFIFMRFSISFSVHKSSLITILDIFSGGHACYPGQQLVWWKGLKLLLSKFLICIKFSSKEGPQQS